MKVKIMFKVRHKTYKDRVFTVYKINKSGTMFFVYDNYGEYEEWKWIYSNEYIPA